MSETPEDIKLASRAACDLCGETEYSDVRIFAEHVARVAILAERDRCASFAETYDLADHPRLSPGSEMNAWWSGQERAYEAVRRGIRGLPPFPSTPTHPNTKGTEA